MYCKGDSYWPVLFQAFSWLKPDLVKHCIFRKQNSYLENYNTKAKEEQNLCLEVMGSEKAKTIASGERTL